LRIDACLITLSFAGHDDSGEWFRLPATMEKSRCIDYAKTSTATAWTKIFTAPILHSAHRSIAG
jgi:hypothetical protein